MNAKTKNLLSRVGHYAKIIWAVPAVKSAAGTLLVRIGMSGAVAGVLVAILDALSVG